MSSATVDALLKDGTVNLEPMSACEPIQVRVYKANGSEIALDINSNDTVANLKGLVQSHEGAQCAPQLIFNGSLLSDDEATLASFGAPGDMIISMVKTPAWCVKPNHAVAGMVVHDTDKRRIKTLEGKVVDIIRTDKVHAETSEEVDQLAAQAETQARKYCEEHGLAGFVLASSQTIVRGTYCATLSATYTIRYLARPFDASASAAVAQGGIVGHGYEVEGIDYALHVFEYQ
mmetsp:Transcript_111323/g.197183  ORF Transcript_111323/g.197183 Transcript_111323/m.197183 type:complete len:232 (-) Transcript_111323:154-849(-)